MGLTFDLKGDAYDKLNKIIAACNDGKPAMTTIGRVLSNRIRLGFKNSTSPYGDKWKPITYRQGQPLRDTGRLLSSIGYNAENDSVSIGTDGQIVYAKIHQFGGVIRPRTAKTLRFFIGNRMILTDKAVIPARPYLPIRNGVVDLPKSWFDDVTDNLAKHIEKQV
jgi:phage gpG-like protein